MDQPFEGSDRWLRADLSVDCNAPDRVGYTLYAGFMFAIYPVSRPHAAQLAHALLLRAEPGCSRASQIGVPALYAYLLLLKHRATLEEHKDHEMAAAADKLMERATRERASTPSSPSRGSPSPSKIGRLSSMASSESFAQAPPTALRAMGSTDEMPQMRKRFSHSVVRDVASKDDELASFYSQLVGGYKLRNYWFEIFECFRKLMLIGIPVFFIEESLEQLVLGRTPAPHQPLSLPSQALRVCRCAAVLVCFLSYGVYA